MQRLLLQQQRRRRQQQQLLLPLLLLLLVVNNNNVISVVSCFGQKHLHTTRQRQRQGQGQIMIRRRRNHHHHLYLLLNQHNQHQHQHQWNHHHQHHHQHRNHLFDDDTHTLSSSSSTSSLSSSSSLSLSSTKTITSTSSTAIISSIRGGGNDRDDDDDDKKQPSTSLSYHLIWTEGFLLKFIITTILLYFLMNNNKTIIGLLSFLYNATPSALHPFIIDYDDFPSSFSFSFFTSWLSSSLDVGLSSWLSSLGLSLMASSCCAIQLIVNVLAPTIGCLGLNTTLGPLRPYFMSLLFYVTITTTKLHNFNIIPQQLIFRFCITFLPEFVDIWNNHILIRRGRRSPINKSTTTDTNNDNDMMMIATIEYDVPTMGCVACINKIDSSLLGQSSNRGNDDDDVMTTKILDVTSWLVNDSNNDRPTKGGGTTQIRIQVKSLEEAELISQQYIEKLKQIGFGKDTKRTKLELLSSKPESSE